MSDVVTWTSLFQFTNVIIGVIGLVFTIVIYIDNKKK